MIRPSDVLSDIRTFGVKLATGAGDAPAYALMEVTGTNADGLVLVKQPSANSIAVAHLCVNLGVILPEGGEGQATKDYPARVLYDTGDGTPAVASPAQSWGSGTASWKLRKDKTGFRPLSGVDVGSALFEPLGSGVSCTCSAVPGGWTDLGTTCEIDLVERSCATDDSKVKRTTRICLTPDGFKVSRSPWEVDSDATPSPP